jgi:hypothetical protein
MANIFQKGQATAINKAQATAINPIGAQVNNSGKKGSALSAG